MTIVKIYNLQNTISNPLKHNYLDINKNYLNNATISWTRLLFITIGQD